MNKKEARTIEVSAMTILKAVGVLFLIYLVYLIRSVILLVFVSLIFAALIDPAAAWFAKRKIPRAVGVLIIYVVLFGIIGGAIVLIIPPLLTEIAELARNFSGIWERLAGAIVSVQEVSAQYGIQQNIERGLASLQEGIARGIGGLFGTIRGFFGGLGAFVITIVLTFYLVVEGGAMRRFFHTLLPAQYHPYVSGLLQRMQEKMGRWLRGEIILMLIVGAFSYAGLLILGVDYALILAIIAGLAELVPYAGPVISAIPAVILAFTQSPLKALFVVVLYFAIQQLENNIIVPKVMQKAIGLNPVVSIVVLLVGFQLAGVIGAVLAIPVATAASVVMHDIFARKSSPES